jgi:hypothetical protein
LPKQIHFWQNPALLIASATGVFYLWRRKAVTTLAVPIAILASAATFAWLQRPWWKWYLLQFEIPLAILSAHGVEYLLQRRARGPSLTDRAECLAGLRRSTLALVLSAWCGFALPAYLKSVGGLYNRHLLEDKEVVRTAILYRDATRAEWCYSLHNELVFASGLLLPPEDVVLSIKRSLVTGVSSKTIATKIRDADLPMLMLRKDNELKSDAWLSWVTNRYEYISQGATTELWINRKLRKADPNGAVRASTDARLKYIYF